MPVVNFPTPTAPPGWYPDPDDSSTWRFWDGTGWTETRSPGQHSPADAGSAGAANPSPGTAPATAAPRPPAGVGGARRARWPVVAAVVALGGAAVWAVAGGGDDPAPTPVTVIDDGGVDDGGDEGPDDDPGSVDADAVVQQGAEAIASACAEFAANYGYGPGVDDVGPTAAVADFIDEWPENPYTGAPMMQGTGAGDFSFGTATSMPGGEYLGYVTAHLGNGDDYYADFEY